MEEIWAKSSEEQQISQVSTKILLRLATYSFSITQNIALFISHRKERISYLIKCDAN